MTQHGNRREFLKRSVLVGAGFWVAGTCAAAPSRSPNEKLNIGIIGVHGRGGGQHGGRGRREHRRPVRRRRQTTWPRPPSGIPKAKTYADWRKMLDQKDLDAVVVSTTDHTHALASVAAMKRGKHVYCEKPLAHSVARGPR